MNQWLQRFQRRGRIASCAPRGAQQQHRNRMSRSHFKDFARLLNGRSRVALEQARCTIERLPHQESIAQKNLDEARAALAAAEADNQRLRTALRWYASGQRWLPLTRTDAGDGLHTILGPSSVQLDNGRMAQEALAAPPPAGRSTFDAVREVAALEAKVAAPELAEKGGAKP
jgi:hypothetical protein